jgi:hypothetical protein
VLVEVAYVLDRVPVDVRLAIANPVVPVLDQIDCTRRVLDGSLGLMNGTPMIVKLVLGREHLVAVFALVFLIWKIPGLSAEAIKQPMLCWPFSESLILKAGREKLGLTVVL